jgi:UDP-N-acetylmuramyl pentapeptide phosphotransferase/UDP-N-acetylglucosamine-1-phosphate transferase
MQGLDPVLGLRDVAPATLLGAFLTLAGCLLLIATRRWHRRYSDDGTKGVQKFHKVPVPRIGGLALGLGYFLVWPALPEALRQPWGLIGIAALLPLGAGLGEDLTGRVGVRWRLLATMAAGVVFALATGYTMHKVYLPGVDWLLSFWIVAVLFTGFAMGGVANAVNIIDGFNGLASGSVMIMLAAFAFVAHEVGDDLVFALAILYLGLIAGFFVLNFPFGRIFLGDGGAYFAGFLLAGLGVLLPMRNPETSAWTAILICAYPVIETLASMRRKARRDGHSVGQPDRVHFHMLAHRRYARRIVRAEGPLHLRNPATSVVTWLLPILTGILAALAWPSVLASAGCFFLTVFIYSQLYRVMSLNAPNLPLGLARLL